MPNYIEMDQGSELWHEWRAQGLGGSDVFTVLNGTTLEKNHLIYRSVTGNHLRFTDNILKAMERGHRLEPEARALINRKVAAEFVPMCVEADFDPRFRASLDGISRNRNTIIEIKCLAAKTHDDVAKAYKTTESAFAAIPPRYYAQIQYQLLVTGATLALYVGYNPESTLETLVVIPVRPDASYQWSLRLAVEEYLDDLEKAKGYPQVISLSGFAKQGKDTVADFLVKNYGYTRFGHADALKQMMVKEGIIPAEMTLEEKDARRQEIVDYSIEKKREFGQDYWSQHLLSLIEAHWSAGGGRVVVSDSRYLNEATSLQSLAYRNQKSFESWSIIKPDGKPANAEEEMSIPIVMELSDFHIVNDSTISALHALIEERMSLYGL